MDTRRKCRCAQADISRYVGKISGPLLERIDLHLQVPALPTRQLAAAPLGESTACIRQRTVAARKRQQDRFKKESIFSNSQMSAAHIRKFCALDEEGQALLYEAVETLGLSARVHDKLLKIARTIADLEGKDNIMPEHLAEAVSYRCLDRTNS